MQENPENKLDDLGALIGSWTGEGRGFGNVSRITNTFEYVLQGHFIRSRTQSTAYDSDGEFVELHEDWGMFSYDPDRDAIVLREFYTEGYVNTYLMEEVGKPGKHFVFTSERTEGAGGLQARLRYDFLSDDAYTTCLDLAKPGEEFRECQVVKMVRDSLGILDHSQSEPAAQKNELMKLVGLVEMT
jgi:hypothetical protein